MLRELNCPFLQGVPDESLQALEDLAHEVRYAPGTCLFSENSRHTDFHIVLEGHVRLEMLVPGRGRIPILTLGPGDVLAWSAVLGNDIMTSTAISLEAVRTASLPGARLKQLCEEQPELGYHLMKQLAATLSRRLLATRLQLLDLFIAHEPVPHHPVARNRSIDPEC